MSGKTHTVEFAFGGVGLRVSDPAKVDDTIKEMIAIKRPVIVDVTSEDTGDLLHIPSEVGLIASKAGTRMARTGQIVSS